MPSISSKKPVEPIVVEYKEEEIKNLLANDAANQIAAHGAFAAGRKSFKFVSAKPDNYRGMKLTFIPEDK